MRYSRNNLLQLKDYHLVIDEDISSEDLSDKFDRIRRFEKVNVKVDGYYDPDTQHLDAKFDIKGDVVVGCDITGEDVNLKIHSLGEEVFTFNRKEDDIDLIKSEGDYINLLPTIFQLIMLEIPIKVVKPGKIDYPKGDGWEVISEEDYLANKEHGDPRLAVLKEYKPQ